MQGIYLEEFSTVFRDVQYIVSFIDIAIIIIIIINIINVNNMYFLKIFACKNSSDIVLLCYFVESAIKILQQAFIKRQ